MRAPKDTILAALANYRGDNTYRARAVFRNRTPEQMQEQWGQSGSTCAQILAEYEQHDAEVDAAIAWVKSST